MHQQRCVSTLLGLRALGSGVSIEASTAFGITDTYLREVGPCWDRIHTHTRGVESRTEYEVLFGYMRHTDCMVDAPQTELEDLTTHSSTSELAPHLKQKVALMPC